MCRSCHLLTGGAPVIIRAKALAIGRACVRYASPHNWGRKFGVQIKHSREKRKNRVVSWAESFDGQSFKNPMDGVIQAWQQLYLRAQ